MADDNTGSWMDFAQRSRDDGGLGLAPHQAAGLVGNLKNESGQGITPWGVSGDNGTAQGSAQWRNERLQALKDHADDNGLDYRTPEAQQSFMRKEFDTTHNGAYRALQASTTPEEAANVVNRKYEISADYSGNRERSARALMDGPTAIEAAMGRTRSTGSQAMAYADPGALTNPGIPQGALTAGGQPVAAPSWLDTLGTTLMNMAPGIAQDPENKKALVAAATAAQKPATTGTWSTQFDPKTGIATQTHSSDGSTRQFKYATPTKDDKTWGVIGTDANGKSIHGYIPSEDEYTAQNTPEAKAKAAADAAAANPQTGLTGQPFLNALATKDKTYAARVQAIIDGREALPTGRAAMEGTPGGTLVKDVMSADPSYDQGNANARKLLRAQYESSSAPNSPANMIKVSGTAMHHGGLLSDAIEDFKSYGDHHDSLIPYGSWALNSANNSTLAGQSTPEAQAYAAAIKMRENYGDEVAKFYGGGPAGEHAKKRAIENLDFAKSLPELRSIMAADMDMIHGKAATLQDAWRTGMHGSTMVPDFPVVSDESQANVARIKGRYDQTKDGSYTGPAPKAAATTTPTTGKFKDVPWSIK